MEVRKPVRKRATELNQGAKTPTQISKSETRSRVQQRLDELHKGIQSKLDEHAGFKQLKIDLQAANQANSRARKDRIEGFEQALRDILEAANRADREWH
jgi:predicted lipid-binding transport protein (Tim44 family)